MLCRMMPVIDLIRTGENIRKIRKQRGITVRQLQEIFGFSTPQAIYKWQQGTALPTIDNLLVLSSVLDVPIERILILEKGSLD